MVPFTSAALSLLLGLHFRLYVTSLGLVLLPDRQSMLIFTSSALILRLGSYIRLRVTSTAFVLLQDRQSMLLLLPQLWFYVLAFTSGLELLPRPLFYFRTDNPYSVLLPQLWFYFRAYVSVSKLLPDLGFTSGVTIHAPLYFLRVSSDDGLTYQGKVISLGSVLLLVRQSMLLFTSVPLISVYFRTRMIVKSCFNFQVGGAALQSKPLSQSVWSPTN
jgi:hypothetical protein